MMSLNEDPIDILARLDAMRVQEQTLRFHNYFPAHRPVHDDQDEAIDASSRASIAAWLSQIQRALSLSPETVWIAVNVLDRYLASGRGHSGRALRSRCHFQLAAITCFYTAVKVYEPAMLDAEMIVKICRGTYVAHDIVAMEADILRALGWRVAVTTPLEFLRHALQLIPDDELPSHASELLLESCQRYLDQAIMDVDLASARPSDLGLASFAMALAESDYLYLREKQRVWMTVSGRFADSSGEIKTVQERLHAMTSPCTETPRSPAKVDASVARQYYRRNSSCGKASPVSVAAPQA